MSSLGVDGGVGSFVVAVVVASTSVAVVVSVSVVVVVVVVVSVVRGDLERRVWGVEGGVDAGEAFLGVVGGVWLGVIWAEPMGDP